MISTPTLKHFVFWPLVALLIYTPFSATIDKYLTGLFYENNHFHTGLFHKIVFNFFTFPAWIVIIASFCILIFSCFMPGLIKWRKAMFFLITVLAVGSGVFIHAIFKEHWGRPRPRQVIEYGGNLPFQPYYQPNFSQKEPTKSFPCGHCSMGFYFFTLILLGMHYKKRSLLYHKRAEFNILADCCIYLGWFFTLFFGGLLSYSRMAQGGHFFSDIIISALIMWLISIACYVLFFRNEGMSERINSETK